MENTGWNYRIVELVDFGEKLLEIRRAYYDKDGNVDAVAQEAADVFSEDLEGLAWTMDMMKKALDKPILKYSDFE